MEELELTYLPKFLPSGVTSSPSKKMLDIYLPGSAEHPILRVRRLEDRYEITKKQPVTKGDSSRQLETTIPLTKEEFAELEKLSGKRIDKIRYFYKENGFNYEVDVFQGKLRGLVLVDIEFQSVEDKSNFTPPEWLLAEITQEKVFAGGMLCGKSYKQIEKRLEAIGYLKIEVQ
ncbi:MAG: adenylate cyclase [Candidatus Levybacteria bacterium]|nr:adenylate cyclase [Candidatus Levybacteria bacterium]